MGRETPNAAAASRIDIASVLCRDPVMYLDDRWLYDLEDDLPPIRELELSRQQPGCLAEGLDLTIVAAGFAPAPVDEAH